MRKYIILFLALVLNSSLSFADKDLRNKVSQASKDYLSSRFMNGTYMFCDDDGVIEQGAKGLHSFETKRELISEQAMPIASTTKTMTAAAILKLRDRGLLDVNDKVAKFLTKESNIWTDGVVPAWANKITIHNLLTHRSGLTEYFMGTKLDITKPHSEINKDIVNFAAGKELTFEPGIKHNYCNTNYVLLGLIIETLSGKNLADFYAEEFFKPLGMNDTRLINLAEAVKHQVEPGSTNYPIRYFVTPTGNSEPQFNVAKSEFIMVPYADGGVASTAKDLITWNKALHSGQIISDSSYKLMITRHYQLPEDLSDGIKKYTGYGLFISELEGGDVVYHHAGKALAIRCESGYIPSKNLYFAVLSNVMNYVPKEMQDKIDMEKVENQLDIAYFTKHIFDSIR